MSLAAAFASTCETESVAARSASYPLVEYQNDPIAYARERLGVTHIMPHQEAILRAICDAVHGRSHARIAVRSGQKCGKTKLVVIAALWFYECFVDARVFMCAAIIEQTKKVLWYEVEQTIRNAKKAGVEIDGELSASPDGGLKSTDESREIKGVSGREIESLAGLSGNMLVIVDEASALPEGKSEAFHGNMMGGGTVVMISNPTRTIGPFYDAFNRHKEHWQTFHIDSEKIAQWQVEKGIHIPYVANLERVNQFREIYGEASQFFRVRVKGDWPKNETGRCINMGAIELAVARWAEALEEGPLSIGYDPAGEGDEGDEHAWAPVRGEKNLAIIRRTGLDEDQAVDNTLSIVSMYRRPNETPRVNIDAEGPIGWGIFKKLRAEAERRLHTPSTFFEVIPVKSSSTKYVKERDKFQRARDEMIWCLSLWMKTGSIPNDAKLQAELYAPTWTSTSNNILFATGKKELRQLLGRSPDSGDALTLAVWKQGVGWGALEQPQEDAPPPHADPYAGAIEPHGAMDPWAALDVWRDH